MVHGRSCHQNPAPSVFRRIERVLADRVTECDVAFANGKVPSVSHQPRTCHIYDDVLITSNRINKSTSR